MGVLGPWQVCVRSAQNDEDSEMRNWTTEQDLPDFLADESGAVTVDWVVLSAAVVGLGMVVLIPVAFSADSSAGGIANYISTLDVGYDNAD